MFRDGTLQLPPRVGGSFAVTPSIFAAWRSRLRDPAAQLSGRRRWPTNCASTSFWKIRAAPSRRCGGPSRPRPPGSSRRPRPGRGRPRTRRSPPRATARSRRWSRAPTSRPPTCGGRRSRASGSSAGGRTWPHATPARRADAALERPTPTPRRPRPPRVRDDNPQPASAMPTDHAGVGRPRPRVRDAGPRPPSPRPRPRRADPDADLPPPALRAEPRGTPARPRPELPGAFGLAGAADALPALAIADAWSARRSRGRHGRPGRRGRRGTPAGSASRWRKRQLRCGDEDGGRRRDALGKIPVVGASLEADHQDGDCRPYRVSRMWCPAFVAARPRVAGDSARAGGGQRAAPHRVGWPTSRRRRTGAGPRPPDRRPIELRGHAEGPAPPDQVLR